MGLGELGLDRAAQVPGAALGLVEEDLVPPLPELFLVGVVRVLAVESVEILFLGGEPVGPVRRGHQRLGLAIEVFRAGRPEPVGDEPADGDEGGDQGEGLEGSPAEEAGSSHRRH